MSSLEISLVALGCLVAGVMLGMWFQYLLPEHHLSKPSQETVKLGAGMIATMSALILGLLVSSAKSSFDAMSLSVAENGARIIQFDHLLAEYGPETKPFREQLKQSLAARVEKIWGSQGGIRAVEHSTTIQEVQQRLRELSPQTDRQKGILAQVQQISNEVWQNRLLVLEQQQEPVPTVFLVLLIFWLTLLFVSFGLYAPRNFTVSSVLFVCALSVASAIFLILEMSHPLDGYIKVSSAPLLKALEMIGQ
jgi:hypothetical protein